MNKEYLAYKLKEYVSSGILPMHMPGHKRKVPKEIKESMVDIFTMDLTEVEGTDNLHDATGIIKDSMEFASNIYRTKKTYYLINGSSCGILAGIRACACTGNYKKQKSYIIIAENAHFSVYNAIELLDLVPIYLNIGYNSLGIADGCDVERLKKLLEINKKKNIVAAMLTSPTYEGVVSDIQEIANILHDAKIPLIVDEAHGAHLMYIEKTTKKYVSSNIDMNFPISALNLGADIVIQSLHKTLPSLTQTALCHINSNLVDEKHLEESLHMFETSSPSYIFMSSIDACIRYMNENDAKMRTYLNDLWEFIKSIKHFEHIHLWRCDSNLGYDFTKLVIYSDILDGITLANILRESYNIETEMSKLGFVLAYSTVCDDKNDFKRLYEALNDIDKNFFYIENESLINLDIKYLNKVAEKNIYIYPPGVPVIKKGDIIDIDSFKLLEEYIKKGKRVYGLEP